MKNKKDNHNTRILRDEFIPCSGINFSHPRQSGHYFDQKLGTKIQVGREEGEKTIIYSRVRLSAAEDKLMNALLRLLNKYSQTHDPKSPDYFAGNAPEITIQWGQKRIRQPAIRVSYAELYEEYHGGKDYCGKTIKDVNKNLKELFDVEQRILHKKTITDQYGNEIEEEIDITLPLITKPIEEKHTRTIKNKKTGTVKVRQKDYITIQFIPLVTDQIGAKFIIFPASLERDIAKAAGGFKRVTPAINAMRDLCLRAISNKWRTLEFNEDILIQSLRLENYIKNSQKKRADNMIKKTLEIIKRAGLIKRYSKGMGAKGQCKYTIEINPHALDKPLLPPTPTA